MHRIRTELGGCKGLVSYGLGADNSLPPCQVGGRLVSETSAHSISDPRAEISGILVMVRRSSSMSRGTTYWFRFFLIRLRLSLCMCTSASTKMFIP